jgi:hypothetical protein
VTSRSSEIKQYNMEKRPLSPTASSKPPRMVKSVSFRAESEEDEKSQESDVSFINQSLNDNGGWGGSPDPYDDGTPEPPEEIFSPRPPIEESASHATTAKSNVFKMDALDEFYDWNGLGDRYELKKIVGSGSYGKVAEAIDRGKSFTLNSLKISDVHRGSAAAAAAKKPPAGTKVAIKQCQNIFQVLKETKQMLRELFILRALSGSDQIVKLLDVKASSRSPGQPFRDL